VAARDEERDCGVFERPRLRARCRMVEHVGADMADEVVDGVERLVQRDGEGLRRSDAHHQRPREAGSARDRDGVELGERDTRLGERRLERGHERLQVGARRDLGHHPAVAGVLVHRRGDHVGEQGGAAHDADAGLVAAGLDAEHQRFARHDPTAGLVFGSRIVNRMTWASTLSGW